jgi:hypothetical protein
VLQYRLDRLLGRGYRRHFDVGMEVEALLHLRGSRRELIVILRLFGDDPQLLQQPLKRKPFLFIGHQ